MRVAVVVDSSAGLPPAAIERHGITVIPLTVVIDGRSAPETEVASDTILAALRDGRTVGTASPGSDQFTDLYRELGARGVDEIVSIHLPESMSPTLSDARAAASATAKGGPLVHVVDGQVSAMGLGWVALTAARAAASGLTGMEIRDLAIRTANRTLVLYAVGDLAHLQRTGRLGLSKALVSNAVGAHPMLRLQRGETLSAGSPLTLGRAFDRIIELATDSARGWPVHLTVQHFCAATAADILRHSVLESDFDICGDLDIVPIPSTIGAYVGGGTVGLVISPTDWLVPE